MLQHQACNCTLEKHTQKCSRSCSHQTANNHLKPRLDGQLFALEPPFTAMAHPTNQYFPTADRARLERSPCHPGTPCRQHSSQKSTLLPLVLKRLSCSQELTIRKKSGFSSFLVKLGTRPHFMH